MVNSQCDVVRRCATLDIVFGACTSFDNSEYISNRNCHSMIVIIMFILFVIVPFRIHTHFCAFLRMYIYLSIYRVFISVLSTLMMWCSMERQSILKIWHKHSKHTNTNRFQLKPLWWLHIFVVQHQMTFMRYFGLRACHIISNECCHSFKSDQVFVITHIHSIHFLYIHTHSNSKKENIHKVWPGNIYHKRDQREIEKRR